MCMVGYGKNVWPRPSRKWPRVCYPKQSVPHVCLTPPPIPKKNPQRLSYMRRWGWSAKMEAAGIEPASESLQLQPLHMLFQGQNSHPSNLPGRTREVLAWFKFRLLLLQAWEDKGYPTSWRPTPSPWASDGRTLAGLLGGQ